MSAVHSLLATTRELCSLIRTAIEDNHAKRLFVFRNSRNVNLGWLQQDAASDAGVKLRKLTEFTTAP